MSEVRNIFDRWQRLESEKAALSEDLKELFIEAKSRGFNPKALRLAFRQKVASEKTPSDTERETSALVEQYLNELHARPLVAREEPPSDGAVKSVRHRRNPELARGAEEPASIQSGASRESASLSHERDDAQPKGGMTGGSQPFRPDLEIPAQMRRA